MAATREPVLLVGAGGLAREVVEALRAGDRFEPRGYLDDDPAAVGEVRNGVPVLGTIDEVEHRPERLVLCPGSGAVRGRLERRLAGRGVPADRYVLVVHPGATVAASATLGAGCVLLAGAVLTAEIRLGRHVVLMPNTVLTHDDELDDAVTLGASATLAGGVRVGREAYLGAGSLVREHVTIGPGALIGQGAVVLHDVPPGQVWVGNPARFLRAAAPQVPAPQP